MTVVRKTAIMSPSSIFGLISSTVLVIFMVVEITKISLLVIIIIIVVTNITTKTTAVAAAKTTTAPAAGNSLTKLMVVEADIVGRDVILLIYLARQISKTNFLATQNLCPSIQPSSRCWLLRWSSIKAQMRDK